MAEVFIEIDSFSHRSLPMMPMNAGEMSRLSLTSAYPAKSSLPFVAKWHCGGKVIDFPQRL